MSSLLPPREKPIHVGKVLAAVGVLAVGAVLVGRALERESDALRYPPVQNLAWDGVSFTERRATLMSAAELAIDPGFREDFGAHTRTLEMYQRLRAYPGAPPRVPHGLTEEEFRGTQCNACHVRGGWVSRFGAFAPVTPHPEMSACLQCHVPQDELVGVARPSSPDAVVCMQCHIDPDASPSLFVPTDWRTTPRPELDRQALDGSPHVVPHDVQSRDNCLACHGGPAAIDEIRTDHPERAECVQCHMVSIDGADPTSLGAAYTRGDRP